MPQPFRAGLTLAGGPPGLASVAIARVILSQLAANKSAARGDNLLCHRLHCTPELRHAGRQLMGDTSARFRFVSDKQSSSRGSVGIPEGFPRPVEAVGNLLLVFHRFHQRRHFGGLAGLLELFRC